MEEQNLFKTDISDLIIQVDPIMIDFDTIEYKDLLHLCAAEYPGHKHGCPNIGKCDRCPPKAPNFADVYDLIRPVYAIVNTFDLGSHAQRMREIHPNLSDRQATCCLYWQGTARKQLKEKIQQVIQTPDFFNYDDTWCPEGLGVDVTKTLEKVGINLEWPPVNEVRQVAILAVPLSSASQRLCGEK